MPSTEAPDPQPGDAYVQSFARGLAVLRSFGADAPAQTLTEAAERTGLTRAAARRILLTLVQLGYVAHDGKWFRLTPRVLELGFAYLTSLPLWQQAQPAMEALVETVQESCSAAVLDGAEIVYVLRVQARRILSLSLGVGSRLPAHCTAMGRVLLAGQPEAQWRGLLDAMPRHAATPRTLTDVDRLLDVLAQVRRQGWSLVDEELEQGLVTLAAPVHDRAGQVVAAINVSGQRSRRTPTQMRQELLPPLLAAAAEVSALLRAHA
jgi:IclR family pca regulon transcriptional regulator